jgi:large subunit ribosomal protein L9
MPNVEVILRDKIENLGAEADVVKVRAGFARNYLIPTGRAFEATKGNLRQLENLKATRAKRESTERSEAESTATKLRKLKLNLKLSTGQGGKAFGSITTIDLAKAITAANNRLTVDRHQIQLDKPIKSTGKFEVPVKLHPDVTATLKVNVEAEAPDAEARAER